MSDRETIAIPEGGWPLARRVWRRYARSPGVV
jgi:hypothetical protein